MIKNSCQFRLKIVFTVFALIFALCVITVIKGISHSKGRDVSKDGGFNEQSHALNRPEYSSADFTLNRRSLSNNPKIISFLTNIIYSSSEPSDKELMKACVVLVLMDKNLKSGKVYEWIEKSVFEKANTRFKDKFSRIISSGNRKNIDEFDREKLRYDDFKYSIEKNGEIIIH